MTASLPAATRELVFRAFEYLTRRIPGDRALYARFRELSYNPMHGEVAVFEPEFWLPFVQGTVTQEEIRVSGGLLQHGDRWIVFARRDFVARPGETDPRPQAGDRVTIGGEIWTTDLGDGKILFSIDPSGTLVHLYIRRRHA